MGKAHVDEFGIHAFDVGEDEKLFYRGVIPDIALLVRVGSAPLGGGVPEEGDIEDIGLVGVGHGGLGRGHLRGGSGGPGWRRCEYGN